MPMPTEVAAKLKASLDRFHSEAVRCAGQAGPDEVHDVRVSIRRFEQALELFGRWLPSKEVKRAGKRLETTLDMAGEVRDRDIALELIGHLELCVGDDLRQRIARDRDAAADRFRTTLRRMTMRKVAARWGSRLGVDRHESVAVLAALAVETLPELAVDFIHAGSNLAHRPKSKRRLHRFRISAKRFRYSMEFLAGLYGPDIEDRIATVRKVQTSLGDLQDCVATRKLLKALDVSRGTLKPLREEESNRLHEFQKLWPKLFGARAHRDWTAFLEHPERRAQRPRGRRPGETEPPL